MGEADLDNAADAMFGDFPVGEIMNATVGIEKVQASIQFLPTDLNEDTAFIAEVNAKRLVAALMGYRKDAQVIVARVMQRKEQTDILQDGILFHWGADGYADMSEDEQKGMNDLLTAAVNDGQITWEEYAKCIRRTVIQFNHIELTRLAKSGRVKGIEEWRRRPKPSLTVKG